MGTPITWQNVNSPDNRLAAQLFESSQNSINSGLDRFTKIITDREKGNQVMADRARMAAQEEYLNMVQGYKTPEELQAARMSGVLDQRLAALDPRNQAAVRGAVDARVTGLQGQVTANDKFGLAQIAAPGAVANAKAIAGRVPTQIALDDAALANQVALQPGAARIALVDQLNKERTSNFNTQRAPGLEALTLQKDALEGSQVAVDATTTAQRRQDQLIEAEIAAASQGYQSQQQAGRQKLGALAKQLGLPVDDAGGVSGLSKEQRLKLDAAAIDAGYKQTTSDLYAGDTKAAEAMVASFRSNPKFTPEAVARNMSKIVGAMDSTKAGMPVGNDALAIASQRATAEVDQKAKDARNRFAPGSPDALNAYEQLATELPGMVPADAQEDVPDLQKMLGKFAQVGIKLKDGRYVTPSAQDIRSAVRSYGANNVFGNFTKAGQAEDIEKQLRKEIETSNVTQLLQDAEVSRAATRQRDIRNLLNDNKIAPAVQPLNPLGLPPPDPKKR